LVFGISAAARKRTGRYNGGRTGGIDCFRDHRLRTKLKKAAERAGLTWAKDLRIHDLRHCCATLMLQGGASVVDVAAILGHSDPTLTLRLYGHAQEHTMRSAVEALCG
jgi:integrase